MILLIDNYDSFVHNLARHVGLLGLARRVVRNDAISLEEVRALQPTAVILSPGPCTPHEAGICLDLVREVHRELPILGVCLGHQCVGQAFGWRVRRANCPTHGKATPIDHEGVGLFDGLPSPLLVGRYHSLVVEPRAESPLRVTARSATGEVMALEHVRHPCFGVQFHPESLLTEGGLQLLGNFVQLALRWGAATRDGAPCEHHGPAAPPLWAQRAEPDNIR